MARDFDTSEAAEAAFYAAFETGDLEAMMAVWVDDESIVCVHPGSIRLSGPAEVRESWRQIFTGGRRLKFRTTDLRVTRSGETAVHSLYEYVSIAGVAGEGGPVIATNIYVATDKGWRLWMHHASTPAMADDEPEDEPPTLH